MSPALCSSPVACSQLPHPIGAVAMVKDFNIVGSGTKIYVFRRKTNTETLEHSPIGAVTHLIAHDKVLPRVSSARASF